MNAREQVSLALVTQTFKVDCSSRGSGPVSSPTGQLDAEK